MLPFEPEVLLDAIDPDGSGVSDSLDLGTASTVPVDAGAVGTAQTSVTVDGDLSGEVFFVLKASDISVNIDEPAPALAQTVPGTGARAPEH